jgi:hypothetical protein
MRMSRTARAAGAAALAAVLSIGAASCSDPTVPPAPTPVAPTITDTFTGTLLQFGSNSHPFTIQQIGGIKVTVVSIDPPAAVSVGVGTPSTASGACIVIHDLVAVASTGVQISGNATLTGNFCVSVSDAGNLVEPVNYTITVLHS